MRTLLIGIGNPGRRDDGLGPALIERLAGSRPPERAIVSMEARAEEHPVLAAEDASCLGSPCDRFPAESREADAPLIDISAGTIDVFWTYQLNIEDAATVGDYDRVVFADAMMDDTEAEAFFSPALRRPGKAFKTSEDAAIPVGSSSLPGAVLGPLTPAASISFTTHEMSPASVLALAEELYGKSPAGFLLKIRGVEWDFAEGLSAAAEMNLVEALRILIDFFRSR